VIVLLDSKVMVVIHVTTSMNVKMVIHHVTRMQFVEIHLEVTIVAVTAVTLVTVTTVTIQMNVTKVTHVTNRQNVSILMDLLNVAVTKDLKAMVSFVQ